MESRKVICNHFFTNIQADVSRGRNSKSSTALPQLCFPQLCSHIKKHMIAFSQTINTLRLKT